jgi:hypothetical protein
MLRRFLVLLLGLLLSSVPRLGFAEGTPALRKACKPDVIRICNGPPPQYADTRSCLEANMANLSPKCRAVFEGRLK